MGTFKVNTDVAIFEDSNIYIYDIVGRDHDGQLLEARSSCKQGCLYPELAEAIGIREALSWVKEIKWPIAEVELDCLDSIQVIRCSSV